MCHILVVVVGCVLKRYRSGLVRTILMFFSRLLHNSSCDLLWSVLYWIEPIWVRSRSTHTVLRVFYFLVFFTYHGSDSEHAGVIVRIVFRTVRKNNMSRSLGPIRTRLRIRLLITALVLMLSYWSCARWYQLVCFQFVLSYIYTPFLPQEYRLCLFDDNSITIQWRPLSQCHQLSTALPCPDIHTTITNVALSAKLLEHCEVCLHTGQLFFTFRLWCCFCLLYELFLSVVNGK